MDKSWHPEHFQCYGCLVQFSGSMSYREKDSHPYCDSCYTDLVLPKCGGCGKPITDRALKAFDTQWHVSCFVCAVRNLIASHLLQLIVDDCRNAKQLLKDQRISIQWKASLCVGLVLGSLMRMNELRLALDTQTEWMHFSPPLPC